MTERGAATLQRSATRLAIGPSALRRDGTRLVIDIDEVAVPWPRRVRGTVTVDTRAWTAHPVALDPDGRHHWTPHAPCARVRVALDRPRVRWEGHAYVDGNHGSEPLETGFRDWQWARATLANGQTVVLYDTAPRRGPATELALRFDALGNAMPFAAPPVQPLPRTAWGIARSAHSDGAPRLLQTLENAPFYARSLVALQLGGEAVTAVHESLALDRFAAPWVQLMLPFRMPRRAGAAR